MGAVCALSPGRLSDGGLIDALVAVRRLHAALAAKQAEFLAEIARRDPQDEGFLRAEVGPALHLAPGVAAERIQTAVALTGRLWDTYDLMGDGHLPATHGRILAAATEDLSDEVTARVQERVLRRAPGQTPGEFRAAVRRAVAHYDRTNHAERHREAVTERRVVPEPAPDGMSWINLFLPEDGAAVFLAAVNARAGKTGPDDIRDLDQRRADGAVELAMAGLAMPGVASAHGLKPVIDVTLAASTWSVPTTSPAWSTATRSRPPWPGTGPPTPRPPGGTGPSTSPGRSKTTTPSAGNLQILCKRHHDAKHATWHVTRTSDGTYHWTSPTRHHYHYRPPEHPIPQPQPPPNTADQPPPPF
jgi:hypothetical protein